MTTDMQQPVSTPTNPRPITVEDVHRMLGAMALEIEMLRRENTALREKLAEKT